MGRVKEVVLVPYHACGGGTHLSKLIEMCISNW